jgi:HSP20 family protein|uniref:Hsp20/alpha crystallin family protein n=1 Tax=Desulfobacca acetoxidans TaxID=60893 RepID=A0A7V6A345_9BACT
MAEQELTPKAKEEAPAKAERVRPGRVFIPAVDIFETPQALVLVADMPGVGGDNVILDLKENLLVIQGQVGPLPEKETMLAQEYAIGDYYREFQVGELIDKDKIEATVKNGVLTLTLPKAEKAKPRRIEVKTG